MAKKKVDPEVAKKKKAKKQAIVLSCLLLGVMAFSIPFSIKKMHALSAPPATAAPAAVTPAPAPDPAAAPPAAGTVAPPVDPAAAGAAQLAAGEAAPALAEAPELEAGDGQLIAFDRFVSKDPFVPQIGVAADPGAGAAAAGPAVTTSPPNPIGSILSGAGGTGGAGAGGPELPAISPLPPSSGSTPATGATGATGFDPQTAPAAPAAPLPTTAMISVNGGTAETVALKGSFPTIEPIFSLVKLTRTSAKIGVVSGNYESGDATIDLTVGKPVTLMNTSDGQRYEILLVSLA